MGNKKQTRRRLSRNRAWTQRRKDKLVREAKEVLDKANDLGVTCVDRAFATTAGNDMDNEIMEVIEIVEIVEPVESVDSTVAQSGKELTQRLLTKNSHDTLAAEVKPEKRTISDSSKLNPSLDSHRERDPTPEASSHVDSSDIANWSEVKNMGWRICNFPIWWREFHKKFDAHGTRTECRYFSSLKFEKFSTRGISTRIYIRCKSCGFIAGTSFAGD